MEVELLADFLIAFYPDLPLIVFNLLVYVKGGFISILLSEGPSLLVNWLLVALSLIEFLDGDIIEFLH